MITNDNPKSNVVLTVVPAVDVGVAEPAASPPRATGSGGLSTGWILLLLALIGAGIIAAVIYVMRARQADEGPIAPPPPPGAKPTSPPPPPSAAAAAGAAGAAGCGSRGRRPGRRDGRRSEAGRGRARRSRAAGHPGGRRPASLTTGRRIGAWAPRPSA